MKSLFKTIASSSLKGLSILLRGIADISTSLAQITDFTRNAHLDFVPRSDDIFIVTYPRSGTTWMQMILYQLTTDGKMDFPHICQVSPWFERLIVMEVMNAAELDRFPSPRVFKSHLSYKDIPKGPCKYIYVARNGKDVAVSYYHFYVSHLFFKGTFSDFFEHRFIPGKVQFESWFEHVAGWRAHKNDPNVLFLRYEDLTHDTEGGLRQIIRFCGLDIPEERFPDILERCSFDFMKAHEDKFDHITGMIWEKGYKQRSFLRKGRTGQGKLTLTPEQENQFDRIAEKYDCF